MNNFLLPELVKQLMAQRARQLHHFIWHSVRNCWHEFSSSVHSELDAIGWKPPQPAFDLSGSLDLNNNCGEVLLFMHREMTAHSNASLNAAADPTYTHVEGWNLVLQPDENDFPVPAVYTSGTEGQPGLHDCAFINSNQFCSTPPNPDRRGGIQHWDNLLGDSQVLESLSLGTQGLFLVFTIHNWMRMRWSSGPGSVKPDVRPIGANSIGTEWDAVSYDWRGGTYFSHSNNHFLEAACAN